MAKIKKAYNLIVILMFIGVFLCADMSQAEILRVPMKFNSKHRKRFSDAVNSAASDKIVKPATTLPGFKTNGQGLYVPANSLIVPDIKRADLSKAITDKQEAIAKVNDSGKFFTLKESKKIKVLETIDLLWDLDSDGELNMNSLIEILQKDISLDIRSKIYGILSRLNPANNYSDQQKYLLLKSIRDYNEEYSLFAQELRDKVAENLSSLSEHTYQIYLDVLVNTPIKFIEDSIPNLPSEMSFGVEFTLGSGNPQLNEILHKEIEEFIKRIGMEERGWRVKIDDGFVEITTPKFFNIKEDFEKLQSDLEDIRSHVLKWIAQNKIANINQGIHIHIGYPDKINTDSMLALAFIGKAMEYYWNALAGTDIENVKFDNNALVRSTGGMAKEATIYYYDSEKNTVAFNSFIPPLFLNNNSSNAILQALIGIAMNITHKAIKEHATFDIFNWGLPVFKDASYTPMNAYILRKGMDVLFKDNNSGKIKMLQLLCLLNKRPMPTDYSIIDRRTLHLPLSDEGEVYSKTGLIALYQRHLKANGWAGGLTREWFSKNLDISSEGKLSSLFAIKHVLKGHTGWIRNGLLTPDGKLITFSNDGTAIVWEKYLEFIEKRLTRSDDIKPKLNSVIHTGICL